MMNDELPEGWAVTILDEIASDVSYGYTAKSNHVSGGAKMLRITDIQDNRVDWTGVPFCEIGPKDKAHYLLKRWDLVFARTGATVGKSFLIQDDVPDAVFASYLIRVRCLSNEVTRYLSYFFNSPLYWDQITDFSAGIGQPNVNGSKLKALRIPLAPLAEQKRIADKLEVVLGRVDACRARLDRVPDLLKRFRQSVLAAATSGRLTEEWRESKGLGSKPWDERRLGQLCEKGRIITYGVIKLGDETPDGVPCLRTSNVRWLRIDTTGMKRIAKSLSLDYSRTILKGGEVLVNVRGTLGGVAVAEVSMAGWNVSREVAVLPVDQKLLIPSFLAFAIGSDATQRWLGGVEKGVAYTGINIEDLRELPVKLPSPPEQQEIVRRVAALFAFADRIEARLTEARTQVERLTPATLAKAFRGELVPQDPNDEPASALLDRLREMRTEPKAGKRLRAASLAGL